MKKIFLSFLVAFFVIVWICFPHILSARAMNPGAAWSRITTPGDALSRERSSMIMETLSSLMMPFSFDGLLVVLDPNQREPRGQFRAKSIRLSSHITENSEFIKLFTHELAHFIDIYVLRTSEILLDPSLDFYKISWQTSELKHPGNSIADFISGYAATNQYEDFAESFVWFVFHNADFADRALKNSKLREKYLFFSDRVFVNGQFQGTDFSQKRPPAYLWDTTKIPIVLKKYLYFLQ